MHQQLRNGGDAEGLRLQRPGHRSSDLYLDRPVSGGWRHPHTAYTLVGLGQYLVDRGKFAEAEPLLQEALLIRRKSLPGGHGQIAEAESALGGCYAGLGRYAEAEPLLRGASATLLARRGAEAPETRRAARRLAQLERRSARLTR